MIPTAVTAVAAAADSLLFPFFSIDLLTTAANFVGIVLLLLFVVAARVAAVAVAVVASFLLAKNLFCTAES